MTAGIIEERQEGRMKMRAVFANDKVDVEGKRFTLGTLRKMAESPMPIPLLLNFNPRAVVGNICCLEYDEEKRELSGMVIPGLAKIPEGHVPVIGYRYDPEKGENRVVAIGVTDKPSTPDTRFEEIKED